MGANEVMAYGQGYSDGAGGHDENELLAHQRDRGAGQEYVRGYADGQASRGEALMRATARLGRRREGAAKRIVVVHDGGAERKVAYLGVVGSPCRALVDWPLAGVYEVSLQHGRLHGPEGYLPWRLQAEDLRSAREEAAAYRAERKLEVDDDGPPSYAQTA